MARIPIPPQQVMPPEGVAPVTQQVDTAGQDALSPTTQVLNYLKARGYTPSTENVRRALEANQRDPGVIGGLRSDTAATEADDQAAMAAARGGGAVGSGGAGGRPLPVPPIPPTGGDPNTSAPPTGGNANPGGASPLDLSNLGKLIIGAAPLLLGGAGGALASRGRSQLPGANDMPGAAAGPMPDPGAGVGAPATTPAPGTGPTDMEAAMNKAVPPELPPMPATMAPNPSGGVPADPAGAALGSLNEQQILSGVRPSPQMPPTQVPPAAEPLPFRSPGPRVAPTVKLPTRAPVRFRIPG